MSNAPSFDEKALLRAKATQSVVMDDDGKKVKVVKNGVPGKDPLSAGRIIRLLDEYEFVWERDFYGLYIDKQGKDRL